MRVRKAVAVALLALGASVGLGTSPAAAQDDDRASQEIVSPGRWVVTPYGQINRGMLFSDDGGGVITYPFVDNSKSSSRLGVTAGRRFDNGWHTEFRGEVGLYWRSTRVVNQRDRKDADYTFDKRSLRYLEMKFEHDQYGTFYVGQGAMATDGVTSRDLSLTTVVAGAAVNNMAGGQFFRFSDGDLSRMLPERWQMPPSVSPYNNT